MAIRDLGVDDSIWGKHVLCRPLKGGKSPLVLYHSIDLSHNVTLLSVPFPQLGSELQAGVTSCAPLSLSAPGPTGTEHRTKHFGAPQSHSALPVAEAGSAAPLAHLTDEDTEAHSQGALTPEQAAKVLQVRKPRCE